MHRESAAYADYVVAIHESGDPATKVDLLLMGDGYTAEETEKWHRDARRMADLLFATSPFKERKDDFNVWALAPAATAAMSTANIRDLAFIVLPSPAHC